LYQQPTGLLVAAMLRKALWKAAAITNKNAAALQINKKQKKILIKIIN